jgi:hypothetical protein
VRLGLPQPTGQVLASASADAIGRWSASCSLFFRSPSEKTSYNKEAKYHCENNACLTVQHM